MVVQWQRIHLPVQETWDSSRVQEDPTSTKHLSPCTITTEPCALEPRNLNYSPTYHRAGLCNERSHHHEKSTHHH